MASCLTREPMLSTEEDGVLAYTLDHTEYAIDLSAFRSCDVGQLWLTTFIVSGVLLGLLFELLHLHAGPAKETTFLLPFAGYVAQGVVGLVWTTANGTWRMGNWTKPMVVAMLLSSLGNGAAQALDYVALSQAGIMLYTILHSSVTLFACLIAYFALRTRINGVQWASVGAVVVGLVLTGIPSPVPAQGGFASGMVSAVAGSLCLAAVYPLSEMVVRYAKPYGAPSAEFCAFVGSIVNIVGFGIWQLVYTMPRWQELVVAPVAASSSPASSTVAVLLYSAFALMVGVHTLAFWKTMGSLGTVPAAISKGAQQGGTFLLAHLFFCATDASECMSDSRPGATTWSKVQKPLAFAVCCSGCLVYALVKKVPAGKVGAVTPQATPELPRLAPLHAPSVPQGSPFREEAYHEVD